MHGATVTLREVDTGHFALFVWAGGANVSASLDESDVRSLLADIHAVLPTAEPADVQATVTLSDADEAMERR